jgi:hypothetical protein
MASIEFVNRLKLMTPYDRHGPDPVSQKFTVAVRSARDPSRFDEKLRGCCGPLVSTPHDSAMPRRPPDGPRDRVAAAQWAPLVGRSRPSSYQARRSPIRRCRSPTASHCIADITPK